VVYLIPTGEKYDCQKVSWFTKVYQWFTRILREEFE